jgi:hypothetical protein
MLLFALAEDKQVIPGGNMHVKERVAFEQGVEKMVDLIFTKHT